MLTTQINSLSYNWKNILLKFNTKLVNLETFLENESKTYESSQKILPPVEKIFNAFNHFDIEKLNVVFIGQDCYHKVGQANGLCFSVPQGVKIPPSLRNIIKEMNSDIGIKREKTDFTDLAQQGILLLNSALTVREKCPASHIEEWMDFTDAILMEISEQTTNVVFVLWGNYAKGKKKFIDTKKHYILEAKHPSPLSANRGGFFGCKHFSKINEYLISIGKTPIKWN